MPLAASSKPRSRAMKARMTLLGIDEPGQSDCATTGPCGEASGDECQDCCSPCGGQGCDSESVSYSGQAATGFFNCSEASRTNWASGSHDIDVPFAVLLGLPCQLLGI